VSGATDRPARIGRAEIGELLADAGKCAWRLSGWERGFLAGLADQVREFRGATSLSEKQAVVFRRIQGKVYAI
jgi:hypothetical protein